MVIELGSVRVENHARRRKSRELKFLRPDAKIQVTVEYETDNSPHRIHTVVLSTQHDNSVVVKKGDKDYFSDEARRILVEKLILPTLQAERLDLVRGDMALVPPGTMPDDIDRDAISCHLNPTR